jgi:hypothetical protein
MSKFSTWRRNILKLKTRKKLKLSFGLFLQETIRKIANSDGLPIGQIKLKLLEKSQLEMPALLQTF